MRYLNEVALAEKISIARPNECPYAVFLGAGCSISSGIPSANAMIRIWQELLYKSLKKENKINEDIDVGKWIDKHYDAWKNENNIDLNQSDYSLLFSYFYQQPKERQLFIENIIEGKKPTFGYLYLAGLIAEKRIDKILTTNFDDLLSDTLMKYYDIKPIISAFDSSVAGIRIASQRPKIIKLHGDFLYDNIKNMKEELQRLDVNMEKKLYEICKDSGLIVVGYSGNDESIMAPLKDMIRKNEYLNMGLHWCIYNPYNKVIHLPKEIEDIKRNYNDKVHIYSISSFDRLFEEIFLACSCSFPKTFINPHENNLIKEFYDSVTVNISGYSLSEYMTDSLNQFIAKVNTQIKSPEYNVIQAELNWNLGMKCLSKSKTKNFKKQESSVLKNKSLSYFKKGYDLIATFFNDYRQDMADNKLLINAYVSRSALCVALSKLETEKEIYYFEAIESVDTGLKVSSDILDLKDAKKKLLYNGCCGISLLMEKKKDDNKENLSKALTYLEKLSSIDSDSYYISQLFNDEDFSFLIKNFNEEIKKRTLGG